MDDSKLAEIEKEASEAIKADTCNPWAADALSLVSEVRRQRKEIEEMREPIEEQERKREQMRIAASSIGVTQKSPEKPITLPRVSPEDLVEGKLYLASGKGRFLRKYASVFRHLPLMTTKSTEKIEWFDAIYGPLPEFRLEGE